MTRRACARALVADDEELVRTLVARVVAEYADTVEQTAGGEQALRALEASAFDLVVTDIRMPIVDGLAVVRWVHRHRPEIKIVAITGYAGGDIEQEIAVLGAELLYKPFGARELRQALERALASPQTPDKR